MCSHARGALREIIDVVASKGWERALKRIKRDDFGRDLGAAILGAMPPLQEQPATETIFLSALRRACVANDMEWETEARALTVATSTEWWTYTYVRIPADVRIPAEELSERASSFGDQLFNVLRPRFAASAAAESAGGETTNRQLAALTSGASSGGSVELFALCRPSRSTRPVPHVGTYMYFDEIGAIKQLPENSRAHALAVACGSQPTSPFCGDVFVGRVAVEPSPARQVSFTLEELDASSEWLRQAPAENATYCAVLHTGAPPQTPTPAGSQHEPALSLMRTMFTGLRAPLAQTVALGDDCALQIESTCDMSRSRGDPTGAVVWDCGVATCAHLARMQRQYAERGLRRGCGEWDVANKRLIELGSGTGIVGLACMQLGAQSVCLTDLDVQLPLIRRNASLNGYVVDESEVAHEDDVGEDWVGASQATASQPAGGRLRVQPLVWAEDWQSAHPQLAARAAAGEFEWIVASDPVYGTQSALPFARVVLDLMRAHPAARLLLTYEERALPETEVNHGVEFFTEMKRAGCVLTKVAEECLDLERTRKEISLWRGRLEA